MWKAGKWKFFHKIAAIFKPLTVVNTIYLVFQGTETWQISQILAVQALEKL